MRRITEVTVVTDELIVRRTRRVYRTRCAACSAEAGMATPEVAAAIAGLRPRDVYRRVEAGTVHYAEATDGTLLVCLASLT